MESLPSSIEAYLSDAGFSGTEVIVLKKLLEEDALTLRELASRTGKSTGVLDQAVKKLMKKGIAKRKMINRTPKITVHSLESVNEWMENDMKMKQSMLLRRQENFQSFMTSLTVVKTRPELEYFEGLDGFKKAYTALLEDSKEMLHFMPAPHKEEEDPLSDFKKEFTKERRGRDIFARIITEDTSLGRRFQSRDDLNYRKTMLVPSDRYPFFIEEVISGGRIGYFDHESMHACILTFSNLAHYDSLFFEADWRDAVKDREIMIMSQRIVTSLPSVHD